MGWQWVKRNERGFLHAWVACQILIASSAFAQTWTQTTAPALNWHALALSADGTKIIAAARDGPIVISTNSGVTWNFTGAPSTNWYSLACSADATKLIATAGADRPIYTSIDAGASWTLATNELFALYYSCTAASADGGTLYFGMYDGVHHFGRLLRSTDAAMTWTELGPAAVSIGVSADGTRLLVGEGPQGLGNFSASFVTSTNSGTTWETTPVPSAVAWDTCAASADGTKLAAAGTTGTGWIYTSKDSGATWSTNVTTPGEWISLACSADGSKLVAAKGGCFNPGGPGCGGPVYTSIDSGATWVSNNVPEAFAVACSADGNKLVAISGTSIWISQSLSPPSLKLKRAATNTVISWIVPSIDFALQQTTNLTTANWTDVTNTPALNFSNLCYEVTLPALANSRFYRLRHY